MPIMHLLYFIVVLFKICLIMKENLNELELNSKHQQAF